MACWSYSPTCSSALGVSYKLEAGVITPLDFYKSGDQNFLLFPIPAAPQRKGPFLQGADTASLDTLPFHASIFSAQLVPLSEVPSLLLYLEIDYSVFRAQFKSQLPLTALWHLHTSPWQNMSQRPHRVLTLFNHSTCPPCHNCLNSSLFHPTLSPPLPAPWQQWPSYLSRSRYSVWATPFHPASREHLDPYQALTHQRSTEDHSPPRALLPFPLLQGASAL